jgi:hypothetical protein
MAACVDVLFSCVVLMLMGQYLNAFSQRLDVDVEEDGAPNGMASGVGEARGRSRAFLQEP